MKVERERRRNRAHAFFEPTANIFRSARNPLSCSTSTRQESLWFIAKKSSQPRLPRVLNCERKKERKKEGRKEGNNNNRRTMVTEIRMMPRSTLGAERD